jgi:hypothetical protein
MAKRIKESRRIRPGDEAPEASGGRKPWEEPKLAFVEPKLTRHGKLEKITRGKHNGFFGQFSP